jgi:uncharacterized protein YbjT (DUF2867 family)
MKVLVLGATGGTGRLIVAEAQAAGHEVVALVRSKERARELSSARLVIGDARDEGALEKALVGCDAVISALGTSLSPFRKVTVLSTATAALINVMRRLCVRRLVAITGVGAGNSAGHGGFLYDRLFKPLLLAKVYADKDRQEEQIRHSGLDWVIVRPTALNNQQPRGSVLALTDLSGVHGGRVARADVARFIVAQLADDRYLRQTPLITWPRSRLSEVAGKA